MSPEECHELVRERLDADSILLPGALVALDHLLARLSAAEQERKEMKAQLDALYAEPLTERERRAEARVEAAEQALAWYEDHKRDDGSYDGDLFGDLNAIRAARQERRLARAALAGREEPTVKDLIGLVPDMTGGLSAEEHVRRLRGEETGGG